MTRKPMPSYRALTLGLVVIAAIIFFSVFQPTGFIVVGPQATGISACTSSWTANTEYELTADIENDDGNCMVIDANNVTLDCMGYTIDGDGDNSGSGVLIANYDQTTVQNCTIKEFNDNIRVAGAITVDHVFRNNNFSAPGNSYNMYLDDAVRVLVHNNTFNDNGLELSYSISGTESNSTIESNTFQSIAAKVSGTGLIYLLKGNNVTVQYNFFNSSVITDSADYGIDLLGGSNYTIQFNNFTNLDGYGVIMFENSENSDVVIRNNNISNNGRRGISGDSLTRSVIANNTIDSNTLQGIYLIITNLTEISGNNITNNLQGIHLNHGSADNNTIFGNNISGNTDSGLNISNTDAANNTIYNNYFNNTLNARDVTANLNFWNVSNTTGTNIVFGPSLGGNYWSDYAGVDTSGDYLGDTQIPYNASDNITSGGDSAPLVINTTALVLTVNAPTVNQNVTAAAPLIVNVTANNTFFVASIQYHLENGSGVVTAATNLSLTSGTFQDGVWVVAYNTTAAPTGAYNLTINVTNTTGSTGTVTRTLIYQDLVAPVISSRASTQTASAITVTWTTDESANYTIFYGSTTALGSEAASTSFDTSHSEAISGLSESTLYYYNITVWDPYSNTNTTGTFNATTTAAADPGSSSSSGGGGGGGSTTTTKTAVIEGTSDSASVSGSSGLSVIDLTPLGSSTVNEAKTELLAIIAEEMGATVGALADTERVSFGVGDQSYILIEVPEVQFEQTVLDGEPALLIQEVSEKKVERHTISLVEASPTRAKVKIESTPQFVTLTTSQPAFVDVNGDYLVDMRIDYFGYKDGRADLRFVSFKRVGGPPTGRTVAISSELELPFEVKPAEQALQPPLDSMPWYVLVLLLAAVLVLGIGVYRFVISQPQGKTSRRS